MSIWNKVFVGLIAVLSLVFLYLSMDALATHRYWRDCAKKMEKRIEPLPGEIELTRFGQFDKGGEGGVIATKVELQKVTLGRGRMWFGCVPGQQAPSGGVSVAIPQPQGIALSMSLFLFEEPADQNGPSRYLGEFAVTQLADKMAVVEPVAAMDPAQVARFRASVMGKRRWTLCEQLPKDSHEIFAGKERGDLAEILPESVVDDFANDGKNGFERKLRDYPKLLKSHERRRVLQVEEIKRSKVELAAIEVTRDTAKAQLQTLQNKQVALKSELDTAKRRRDLVVAHLKAIEAQKAQCEADVKQLAAKNQAMADQIAKLWEAAARRIDQRAAVASR